MATCTCNDTTQTFTRECFHCKATWSVPMDDTDRMGHCNVHHDMAPRDGFHPRELCAACIGDGWILKMDGFWPCWQYSVVKK